MSEPWRSKALCKGKSLDMWYPPLETTSPNDYYALGKLACYRCPVWGNCLQSASNEVWGMWGGLTPQERKGTHKPAHGTIELYRLGCECAICSDSSEARLRDLDLALLPKIGVTFDAKSLLFDIINR